ncbi:hypothetical protein [Mycobacterium sp. OTB74]|uniref:hypothetical protein n=1 Tax=Mycobacterium sp. OTB74 TaxID=1853452 RepID=UPI00247500E5|nr:hypothetical protein [Mycobacterium sp. OTB74]MDH6245448.1 hypothetical protein [Mycobacterium sp. OTB74]
MTQPVPGSTLRRLMAVVLAVALAGAGVANPAAPEVQTIRADFIDGYDLNMATLWITLTPGCFH